MIQHMAAEDLKPYQFKPGQTGNPGGRPKQVITVDKLRTIIDKISLKSMAEIREMVKDESLPIVEMQIAAAMLSAATTGDFSKVALIMDRLLGKVPQVLDQNVKTEDITASKENVTELYDIAKRLHKTKTA